MINLQQLAQQLHAMVIFRKLLQNKLIASFLQVVSTKKVDDYAQMTAVLYEKTDCLSDYILEIILENENGCILMAAEDKDIPTVMCNALSAELETLCALSQIKSEQLCQHIEADIFLPQWTTKQYNFSDIYFDRLKNIHRVGYGIFSKYETFVLKDMQIEPVLTPDPITIESFSGYELEREKVIKNTRALVEGRPASNALLYGDAGTGKSSTVKAVSRQFAKDGLRLIEVKKKDLYQLPQLLDGLNKNPLKFIIFIDDLSFNSNDDNFAALKAILEGSVACANSNIAVYATSNRRHLIKESFSDRVGDDIHENDTKEELRSLSARFGLTVTFSRPDKDLYLTIIDDLADEYGISMDSETLHVKAEAFALRASGRSPRVAKQFIKGIAAKVFE